MHYLLRSRWQLIKTKCRDDAKIASAPSAACAEEVGVSLLIGAAWSDFAIRVNRKNVDSRYPIYSKPVKAGEYTVSTTANMAAGPN